VGGNVDSTNHVQPMVNVSVSISVLVPTTHFVNWVAVRWRKSYDKYMWLQKCIDQNEIDLEATIDDILRGMLMRRINLDTSWQQTTRNEMDFDVLIADYKLCFESTDGKGNITLHGEAAQALQRQLMTENLSDADTPPPLPEASPPASPSLQDASRNPAQQLIIREHEENAKENKSVWIQIDNIGLDMHVVTLKSKSKVLPVNLAANREKRQYKYWSARRPNIGPDAPTAERRSKWERVRDTVLVQLMRCILK
jgi:hypothetical protein